MLCLCLLASREAIAQAPRFSASDSTIADGDTVELRWSCPSCDSVYISGIGVVPPAGSRRLVPRETTTYSLVADGGALPPVDLVITITVENARGSDGDFPAREAFRLPRSYTARSRSAPALLERIHLALQDSLKHSVREVREGQTIVFETNLVLRPDLLSRDEPTIRSRRLAYRVLVPPRGAATDPLRFIIEMTGQYQRRVESTWRSDTVAVAQAERLARLVGTAP